MGPTVFHCSTKGLIKEKFMYFAQITNPCKTSPQQHCTIHCHSKYLFKVWPSGIILLWPAHDPALRLFPYALLLSGIKLSVKRLSLLYKLVAGVLKPQLVWRAGRSAEALRTAAVGCVVAALNLHACTHSLAESLVPLLLSLLEDPAFKTRQFATLALLNIVKSLRAESSLNAEDISQIFVGRLISV